ncbi:MAG: hypothetical protein MZW92_58070 [Comamonadaceae bacterium]|nr:hypothetical protein [Comamonadaceae bacterium]
MAGRLRADAGLGPSVAVMPVAYKPFDVFVQDDRILPRLGRAFSRHVPAARPPAQGFLASTRWVRSSAHWPAPRSMIAAAWATRLRPSTPAG